MRFLVGLAFALAACAGETAEPETSVVETRFEPLPAQQVPATSLPAPPINWADWGQACPAGILGLHPCRALDGVTIGWCQHLDGATDPDGDGIYAGECRPACLGQPAYQTRCPSDAVPTETVSEGCYCKRL